MSVLRELFDATPLRVPEERIGTLSVIASDGKRSRFMGDLAPLLAGDDAIGLADAESSMASLSGRRSRTVDLGLGMDILSGFLPSLGIPLPGIEGLLRGSSGIDFALETVKRKYVEVTRLGKALTGRRIDTANPAAKVFSEQRFELLVIDSVLVSDSFAIRVTSSGTAQVQLDPGTLAAILPELQAGASVSASGESNLLFRGPRELTFAFSCVRLYIALDGTLGSIEPDRRTRMIGFGHNGLVLETPNRVLLTGEPELLDWDAADR